MKTEVETEPKEIPDYTTIAALRRSNIEALAMECNRIDREMKRLKEERSRISDEGVRLLAKAGVKTVLVLGMKTTLKNGTSTSISKEKLYKLGVSEKIIAKATTKTPWTTLIVTPPKENGKQGS